MSKYLGKSQFSKIDKTCKLSIVIPLKAIVKIKDHFTNPKRYSVAVKIICQLMYKYLTRQSAFFDWQNCSQDYKRKIIGNGTHYKVWGELERIGILEVSRNRKGKAYSTKGSKCKRYRIAPKCFSGPVQAIAFQQSKGILKNNVIALDSNAQIVGKTLSKLKISKISREELDHTHQQFFNKIKAKYEFFKGNKVKVHFNKQYKWLNAGEINQQQFYQFLKHVIPYSVDLQLRSCAEKMIYVKYSKTNNRLNHPLTNIDKLLLGYFRLDNQKLVSLDLCNSQPLILANVLIHSISNNVKSIFYNKYIYRYYNDLYTNSRKIPAHTPSPPTLLSPFSNLDKEINTFSEHAKAGKIYTHFGQKLLNKQNINSEERSNMKLLFIASLFGSSDPEKRGSSAKQFATIYPELSSFISGFKILMQNEFEEDVNNRNVNNPYIYSKTKGYKSVENTGDDYLSIYLQRIESKVFIKMLLPELNAIGLSVLPVHDSFLFPLTQKHLVNRVVSKTLDNLLGEDSYKLKTENTWKTYDFDNSICKKAA